MLRRAGFEEVRSNVVSRIIRFEADAPFLRLNAMVLAGMSAAGKAMSDPERKDVVEEIVSDSVPIQQSYTDGSTLSFELRTNLATATASVAFTQATINRSGDQRGFNLLVASIHRCKLPAQRSQAPAALPAMSSAIVLWQPSYIDNSRSRSVLRLISR